MAVAVVVAGLVAGGWAGERACGWCKGQDIWFRLLLLQHNAPRGGRNQISICELVSWSVGQLHMPCASCILHPVVCHVHRASCIMHLHAACNSLSHVLFGMAGGRILVAGL